MSLWRSGTHTTAELAELFTVARSTVYRAGPPPSVAARPTPSGRSDTLEEYPDYGGRSDTSGMKAEWRHIRRPTLSRRTYLLSAKFGRPGWARPSSRSIRQSTAC